MGALADLGPAQSGTTGTETHPSEAGACDGNKHAALGMWGHTGRAVAEQLVGERLCDMGRRCVLQVEIEEDNTPPLSGGVDRRRFVIHRGHGQRAWSHCGHDRC